MLRGGGGDLFRFDGTQNITVLRNPGSGTFLTPGSGTGKKSRSGCGIRNRDEHPGSYFRELRKIFGLNILKFFDADPDPGFGIFLTLGPGSGTEKIRIRDKHPGSATLEYKLEKQINQRREL
jgi:hypothetical protein